jgi:murein DD-endopeptidase MepM/ murein hydrolase activator NlpD
MVQIADEFRRRSGSLAERIHKWLPKIPLEQPSVWSEFKFYAQVTFDARALDFLQDVETVPVLKVAELGADNGQFRIDDPNAIYLAASIADFNSELDEPRYRQLIESTILHELVHWCNFRRGDVFRGNPLIEWGVRFEEKAYGRNVDRYWITGAPPPSCGTCPAALAARNEVATMPIPDPPALLGEAPFARSDASGRVWPIRTSHPSKAVISYLGQSGRQYGEPSRSFFALRAGNDASSITDDRHHVGLDLYGAVGDTVVACEAGQIVNIHPFYLDTMALLVLHDSGIVVNYGEIARDSWGSLRIGDRVAAGQPIARIGQLNRGSMCHFETYTSETRQTTRWKWNTPRPDNILNPTRFLLELPRP